MVWGLDCFAARRVLKMGHWWVKDLVIWWCRSRERGLKKRFW